MSVADAEIIETYVSRINEIAENRDWEGAHIDADALLVSFLKEMGFDELAKAYDKVGKWYA